MATPLAASSIMVDLDLDGNPDLVPRAFDPRAEAVAAAARAAGVVR